MGIVFVLLLGEIDLSVGFVSGVAGVLVALLTFPDNHHVFAAGPALVLALARRHRHRPAARRDHHEARRALLRRDAGGPAGLERGRAAAHRRQGHRHHPEQLLHRLRQRLPAVGDGMDPGRRRHRAVRGDAVLAAGATITRGAHQRSGRGPVAAHRRVRRRRPGGRLRVRSGPRHPVRDARHRRPVHLLDLRAQPHASSGATSTRSAATPRPRGAPASTSTTSRWRASPSAR